MGHSWFRVLKYGSNFHNGQSLRLQHKRFEFEMVSALGITT